MHFGLHFNEPGMLWCLAMVPLVLLFVWLAFWRRNQFRGEFADQNLIEPISQKTGAKRFIARAIFIALGLSMVVLALARPVIDNGRTEIPQGTTDMVLMVDVSRSMAAVDYKGKIPSGPFDHGTRLDMARYLVEKQVLPVLGANRMGIVTYAGKAFPLGFLTQDTSALNWVQVRAMSISSAPGDGSALVQSFKMAFAMFDLDSNDKRHKIIVLFSDGGNDDGIDELRAVTRELMDRKIQLIVVALGKTTPSPIPYAELPATDRRYANGKEFFEENGEIAQTRLDENALKLLANGTGGTYIHVVNGNEFSMEALSRRLDVIYEKGQEELFFWPLVIGLVLLVIGWFALDEPRPRSASASARPSLLPRPAVTPTKEGDES